MQQSPSSNLPGLILGIFGGVARWRLLIVGMLLTLSITVNARNQLQTVGNPYFEIVGLDRKSLNYVNELSRLTVEICEPYLNPNGLAYPLPILVNLRPGEFFKFKGDHRILPGSRKAIELDLRWEDPLTLERTAYLLTKALLLQYRIFNHGSADEADLPVWLLSGLASEVYFRLRPFAFIDRLERVRSLPVPSPDEILQGKREGERFGFLLLHVLNSDGKKRADIRKLVQLSLAGYEMTEQLNAVMKSRFLMEEFPSVDTWWLSRVREVLDRESGVFDSMKTTRQWLRMLADFTQVIELETGAGPLNLRALWEHRDSVVLRKLIQARYILLRSRFGRTNPAYIKAAQSLGILYEILLEGDSPYQYTHALVIYLSDWGDAQKMQSKIENALSAGP